MGEVGIGCLGALPYISVSVSFFYFFLGGTRSYSCSVLLSFRFARDRPDAFGCGSIEQPLPFPKSSVMPGRFTSVAAVGSWRGGSVMVTGDRRRWRWHASMAMYAYVCS